MRKMITPKTCHHLKNNKRRARILIQILLKRRKELFFRKMRMMTTTVAQRILKTTRTTILRTICDSWTLTTSRSRIRKMAAELNLPRRNDLAKAGSQLKNKGRDSSKELIRQIRKTIMMMMSLSDLYYK